MQYLFQSFLLRLPFRFLAVFFSVLVVTFSAYWPTSAQLTSITVGVDCASVQACIDLAQVGDTVLVPEGEYLEHVTIDKSLQLEGTGAALTIIDGRIQSTVINILDNVEVTIAKITVTNGIAEPGVPQAFAGGIRIGSDSALTLNDSKVAANSGAGIYIDNFSSLTVNRSIIENNSSFGIWGGLDSSARVNSSAVRNNQQTGILADAVRVTDSIISGNVTTGSGGAVRLGEASARIINSTIVNNHAQSGGGAFKISSEGSLYLTNSTVSGNHTEGNGGAIHIGIMGNLQVFNSTIVANEAGGEGSGIYAEGDDGEPAEIIKISNSVIAKNRNGSDCVIIDLDSMGYNLDSDGTCLFNGQTDLSSQDPLLGPLQDNGGPTVTHMPNPGSPLINAGDIDGCRGRFDELLLTDQRGISRPQGERCDVGSVEVEHSDPPDLTPAFLLVSTRSAGIIEAQSGFALQDVYFSDDDILIYSMESGYWARYFDGSDVGLSQTDIDAFSLMDDGSILMSFNSVTTLPGINNQIQRSDIVRFIPEKLGSDTSGEFEHYFIGKGAGLTGYSEDIDAMTFTPDERLVVSTRGSYWLDGLTGKDDDLIVLNNRDLVNAKSSDWAILLDGSDVGLSDAGEDIRAAWINPKGGVDTADIYFSTLGTVQVDNVNATGADSLICSPLGLGQDSACLFDLFFDGTTYGLGGERIDGLSLSDESRILPYDSVVIASSAEINQWELESREEDVGEMSFETEPHPVLFLPFVNGVVAK